MFTVGHEPRIQSNAAATDTSQRKHTAVPQCRVDFFKKARQVGLLLDVVGVLGNKMRHRALLVGRCAERRASPCRLSEIQSGKMALIWPVPELPKGSVRTSTGLL
ncbi:hypothetical protein D3C84_924600 [compost metagenome]